MDQACDDADLLRQYADTGSEAAFACLVARHTDMVYSAARRQVGPGDLADEVTQAAFILLMRKAHRLPRATVVAAWLYKATRYTALNARRAQTRRRRHETKAAHMAHATHTPTQPWIRVEPLLDEAIARLNANDRNAVVLRYLERRSLAEVGHALGISESAAHMRVQRAVEKMRAFFGRRGVTLTAAALGIVLSAQATQAASTTLVASLDVTALKVKGTLPTGPAALADSASRGILLGQVRSAVSIAMAAAVVLGLGVLTADVAIDQWHNRHPPATNDADPPRPAPGSLARADDPFRALGSTTTVTRP